MCISDSNQLQELCVQNIRNRLRHWISSACDRLDIDLRRCKDYEYKRLEAHKLGNKIIMYFVISAEQGIGSVQRGSRRSLIHTRRQHFV